MGRPSALRVFSLGFIAAIPYMSLVSALGTTCSTPLGSGSAAAGDPYWLESMKSQGIAAFNTDPSTYQVFRNVKDFGAKGDGTTDDTAAINAAMTAGTRCGDATCTGSSTQPAVIYFPSGTYVVSDVIVDYYYTEIIGDAKNLPVLKATAGFAGIAIIDADPYIPNASGAEWYVNQNNFYRSIKNMVFDTTNMPATAPAVAVHWQVSQATSMYNVVFQLSSESGSVHQGIHMENGSGGFMADIVINGGGNALDVGNQQFTVRNLTVNGANTAVAAHWNWGWNFQDITISDCQVGFNVTTGTKADDSGQGVGAEAIMDAVVSNTPIFYQSSQAVTELQGSIVLNNIKLTDVPVAVGVIGGATVLAGGSMTIDSWVQGNTYSGSSATGKYTVGNIDSIPKAAGLLDGTGRMFGRGRPTYASYATSEIVSVRDEGAKGDGSTDDTAALQAIFDKYSGCKIIYFNAGTYIVTSTLKIPEGTQIFGEAWAVLMGSGNAFSDQTNPQVVVQVGAEGSSGVLEIGGVIFSTRGPAPGAVVVEWNIAGSSQGSAGMWDSYIRLGGTAGSDMQLTQCPVGSPGPSCYGAFLALHLTAKSNAYIEGAWVWLADHDVENTDKNITVYSGRGVLSESQGPVWLVGTGSEHHALYQYNLAGAASHYLGLPQTETPYYQPSPAPPTPFASNDSYHDPTFTDQQVAWGLKVSNSKDILIFGAGLYSFFQNYNEACLNTTSCQSQVADIDSASTVNIYSLSTVGIVNQISVDEKGIIPSASNLNGLAQTVTHWSSS